jgi:prepilin-type N-terminal cleavage/methylation domain-containing protein
MKDRRIDMHVLRLRDDDQGFTLIEAMICILLVSIGFLSITKMQVGSISGNVFAIDTMRASLMTSAVADRFSCSLFTGAELSPADTTGATMYPCPWPVPDPRYTIQYSVKNVPIDPANTADPLKTLKIITLITTWNERGQVHT